MLKKKSSIKREVSKINCVWGILCSFSSIDQERNNLSLFNVIEQVSVPKEALELSKKENKPVFVPLPVEIVLFWRRILNLTISDEEILTDFKIRIMDASGGVLHEVLHPIKFPRGIRRMRFRMGMNGLVLSQPGDYVIQIEERENGTDNFVKSLDIPFEVTAMEQPMKLQTRK